MKLAYALLGIFLTITAIIAGSAAFSINETKNALEKEIIQEAETITTNTIKIINRRLTMRINLFEIITHEEEFQESLRESNKEFETMQNRQTYINQIDLNWQTNNEWQKIAENNLSKQLNKLKINLEKVYGFPIFAEAIITNKYGATIAMTNKITDYRQDDEEWWKQSAHNGAYIEGISYDESADIQTIIISTSIKNEKGEFIGIIKAALYLQDLINIIEETSSTLPHESTLKWTTEDGRIIYSNKPYQILQYDPLGLHSSEEKTHPHKTSDKIIIHSHSTLKNAKWSVILEIYKEHAFAQSNKLKDQLILITTIAALFSLAMGIIITRKTIQPLTKIKNAIDEISKGNFEAKLSKTNIDELQDLTDSTNRILTTLKIAVKRAGIKKEQIIPGETHKTHKIILDLFKKNFENSPTSMLLAEYQNNKPIIINVNKKFTEYYKYTQNEAKGKSPNIVSSGKQDKKFYQEMWKALKEPKLGYWTGEIINKTKKGKLVKVLLTINTIFDEEQKPKYFIANHLKLPDQNFIKDKNNQKEKGQTGKKPASSEKKRQIGMNSANLLKKRKK